MKKLARRVLTSRPVQLVARPLLAPFRYLVAYWARQAVAPRLDDLDRQARAARAELDGMDRYVPVILSSIQAQNAMSRATARTHEELAQLVRSTLERFEQLRDQTRAELRGLGHAMSPPFVETKVLNPDKLEAARGQLQLDLGPEHDGRPGHIHVDPRPADGVDVVGDVRDLPFEPGSATQIFSAHLVGSFSVDELADQVLPNWVSVLQPEGTLTAVVGDLDALLNEYLSGRVPFEDLKRLIFGAPEAHNRIATFGADELGRWFLSAGLTEVSVRPAAGAAYEVEVTGCKPAAHQGA
jgi:hypothetical protein